jgi:hypothetical protein
LFEEGEFESLFVELSSSEPIIVGEIYRVPDTNQILSLERYETILNKIEQTRLRAIIGTDQNFDYLKIDSNKVTSDLLDLYIYNNMLPMITKPTRVTQTTATLIDNIYVNHNSNCVQSGIMYMKLSDHFPMFCFAGAAKVSNKPKVPLSFKHRPISTTALNNIINELNNHNWDYLNEADTIGAYSDFVDKLGNIIDAFAPEKNVIIQPKYIIREKWMTKGLMKSSHTMNKLYRKCSKKPKTDNSYIYYKTYRNVFNVTKNKAKTTYYTELFNNYKNDIKKTWILLRGLIGKQNDKSSFPVQFKYNGNYISDPQLIANQFCDYFTNVGPELAKRIPEPTNEYRHYLSKAHNNNKNSLFFSPTDPNEIDRIIKSLK